MSTAVAIERTTQAGSCCARCTRPIKGARVIVGRFTYGSCCMLAPRRTAIEPAVQAKLVDLNVTYGHQKFCIFAFENSGMCNCGKGFE